MILGKCLGLKHKFKIVRQSKESSAIEAALQTNGMRNRRAYTREQIA